MIRALAAAAIVAVTGYLVWDRPITTVTGRAGHQCIYDVGGEQASVIRLDFCPYTLDFQ